VRRNGAAFEAEIAARNRTNVNFGFLKPENPYNAYYRMRLRGEEMPVAAEGTPLPKVVEEPAVPVPAAPAEGDQDADAAATDKAEAKVDTLAAKLRAMHVDSSKDRMPVPPPVQPEQYTVRFPPNIAGLDVDVVKLTAQFVARNGRQFLVCRRVGRAALCCALPTGS
jgi:splicing factor 3A subunit 1